MLFMLLKWWSIVFVSSRLNNLESILRKSICVLFFILFILLLLLFLLLAGYQCPLRFFLGIPCPFCGMTRAFLCVLEGDLAKSFFFHPLWPIVLGIIIFFPLFLSFFLPFFLFFLLFFLPLLYQSN